MKCLFFKALQDKIKCFSYHIDNTIFFGGRLEQTNSNMRMSKDGLISSIKESQVTLDTIIRLNSQQNPF